MQSFKSYLTEAKTIKQVPWNGFPEIGWWRDQKKLTLYHGTNVDNLPGFAATGLSRPDPNTKMYSFAFEPFTARAFAVMGGEARFLNAKAHQAKQLVVPENKRAVLIFELPIAWIEKYMDPDLSGNDPSHKERLMDKDEYEKFSGSDQQYYQLCELRVTAPVDAKYIKGYMIK